MKYIVWCLLSVIWLHGQEDEAHFFTMFDWERKERLSNETFEWLKQKAELSGENFKIAVTSFQDKRGNISCAAYKAENLIEQFYKSNDKITEPIYNKPIISIGLYKWNNKKNKFMFVKRYKGEKGKNTFCFQHDKALQAFSFENQDIFTLDSFNESKKNIAVTVSSQNDKVYYHYYLTPPLAEYVLSEFDSDLLDPLSKCSVESITVYKRLSENRLKRVEQFTDVDYFKYLFKYLEYKQLTPHQALEYARVLKERFSPPALVRMAAVLHHLFEQDGLETENKKRVLRDLIWLYKEGFTDEKHSIKKARIFEKMLKDLNASQNFVNASQNFWPAL